jgi:hypothetical protein
MQFPSYFLPELMSYPQIAMTLMEQLKGPDDQEPDPREGVRGLRCLSKRMRDQVTTLTGNIAEPFIHLVASNHHRNPPDRRWT